MLYRLRHLENVLVWVSKGLGLSVSSRSRKKRSRLYPCQWHTEVWWWPYVTLPRWASLAGCAREGYLQDGCHDVPLSSWSGTSVPRRPFHHVLRRRFSASSAFCKPSPAHCTSLSSQHMWPSKGVFHRQSDCLELAAWRA